MVETIATVAGSVVAVLGVLGVTVRWIDRRGRDQQSLTDSIQGLKETGDRQARAMEGLGAQVGGLAAEVSGLNVTLTEHHFRLKALEDREVRVIVK
jgi:hypothetical protein